MRQNQIATIGVVLSLALSWTILGSLCLGSAQDSSAFAETWNEPETNPSDSKSSSISAEERDKLQRLALDVIRGSSAPKRYPLADPRSKDSLRTAFSELDPVERAQLKNLPPGCVAGLPGAEITPDPIHPHHGIQMPTNDSQASSTRNLRIDCFGIVSGR